jgi:hypothetical protein
LGLCPELAGWDFAFDTFCYGITEEVKERGLEFVCDTSVATCSIEADARPNAKALLHAVNAPNASAEVVSLLILHGAPLQGTPIPLHSAVETEPLSLAKVHVLLAAGSDFDRQ